MYLLYIIMTLAFIFILYLLSIKPNKKRDASFLLGRFYAHRGLHDNKGRNPENSFTAFKMAVEQDFGIELDVQVTKDHIPVIFHDGDLKRMCGLKESISNFTFDELKKLRLFKTDEYIPTFREILDLVDGRVPLIIEIKNDTTDVSEIKYTAEILDAYKGDYVIESFNPLVLMWYKKNRPSIIRGQLSSHFKNKNHSISRRIRDIFLENFMTNFLTKPDFIAFNYKYKDKFSFNLCKKLYKPLTATYTIKSQKVLKENLKDFDLFIFDSFIPRKDTN